MYFLPLGVPVLELVWSLKVSRSIDLHKIMLSVTLPALNFLKLIRLYKFSIRVSLIQGRSCVIIHILSGDYIGYYCFPL